MFGFKKKIEPKVEAIEPGEAVVPTPVRHRHVAFVVVHGMGQQVPYETLSALTECMVQHEEERHAAGTPPNVSVDLVELTPGNPPLARAAFTVRRAADDHVKEF